MRRCGLDSDSVGYVPVTKYPEERNKNSVYIKGGMILDPLSDP
jgi:hypothetical protein